MQIGDKVKLKQPVCLNLSSNPQFPRTMHLKLGIEGEIVGDGARNFSGRSWRVKFDMGTFFLELDIVEKCLEGI